MFGQENVVDTKDLPATLLGETRSPQPLPGHNPTANEAPTPLKEALGAAEKRILEQALTHCDGNRERTARVLGINRSTLFAKLRRHGVR